MGKRRPKQGRERNGKISYICICIISQLSASKVLFPAILVDHLIRASRFKVTMMSWPRLPKKKKKKKVNKNMLLLIFLIIQYGHHLPTGSKYFYDIFVSYANEAENTLLNEITGNITNSK